MTIHEFLTQRADLYKPSREPDGMGGHARSTSLESENKPVLVMPASTRKLSEFADLGVQVTDELYTLPSVTLDRNWEVKIGEKTYKVKTDNRSPEPGSYGLYMVEGAIRE